MKTFQFFLILIAWVSVFMLYLYSFRVFRRNNSFRRHMLDARRHLLNAAEFRMQGEHSKAEVQLAASREALDRAQEYL